MQQQSLANHNRIVKGYHVVLTLLLLSGLIASLVNIYLQWRAHYDMLTSILVSLLFICGFFMMAFLRQFPLKAQDRVIRAEENFRHYLLTNKQLDTRLSMQQIIALRFAPDEEFLTLADRAAKHNLSPLEIKKEIRNWRADNHRL